MRSIISGLALLSAYGLYKWSYGIAGLQVIDFIIIGLSSVFALVLIITEARKKRPFWILQTITTITFSVAFITLGMKMPIGWYALLIGHVNNTFLYYKKGAYIIGVMQIISIIIVLVKILS